MNTLTQQQINQYQWRVADGAAVPVNPIPYNVLDENWVNKASELLPIIYHTNAPDGIYSGEAFELEYQGLYESGWFKISELLYRNYVSTSIDLLVEDTRLFLRLKPSHLPAVLTTHPGEEWKDRYREVWFIQSSVDGSCSISKFQPGSDYADTYDWFASRQILKTKREWHLNTPPAEQEAETVVYNDIQYPSIADALRDWYSRLMVPADSEDAPEDLIEPLIDKNILLEGDFRDAIQQLQSTLTQKDQRIAELEQMLDQCQKNDLYFEQEKEQLNNRIAELEREREWISVDDRLPEDGRDVLTTYHFKHYEVANVYSTKEKRFVSQDGNSAVNATHWQEITPPQH